VRATDERVPLLIKDLYHLAGRLSDPLHADPSARYDGSTDKP
jgi:hypothetical protein